MDTITYLPLLGKERESADEGTDQVLKTRLPFPLPLAFGAPAGLDWPGQSPSILALLHVSSKGLLGTW